MTKKIQKMFDNDMVVTRVTRCYLYSEDQIIIFSFGKDNLFNLYLYLLVSFFIIHKLYNCFNECRHKIE